MIIEQIKPVRDLYLISAAAFLRALATGMIAVLIGIYLFKHGFDAAQTGIVVGAGLSGAAVAAVLVTVGGGDHFGRRKMLVALALLGATGGLAIAASSQLVLVVTAAFVGMLNGMGRDRGASLIIDQAMMPALTSAAGRTATFARYHLLQDLGHAMGGLLAAGPALVHRVANLDELALLRAALVLYAGLLLMSGVLYRQMSAAGERSPTSSRPRVSRATKRILWRLCALFAIDSIAGGFLTAALLAFFFFERFDVGTGTVAVLFFAARIANAASHLLAAWLAKRIGLVNTMVFTHIPSSLLLVTVALASSFWAAALLFLLREGLVEMDVPTRQSYVMAVVRPQERALAAGVTHLVRLGAWALAPSFAGLLMRGTSLAMPLCIGAGMKIVYDVLLYLSFRQLKPDEERA